MRWWPFWILIIAIVSGPWFGIVNRPQWQRVTWIPFHGFEDKPKDIVANFLLFVPFGWSFAKSRRAGARMAAAVAAATLVSIAVEIPQLFYKLRDPSATDVFMAICGAAVGSLSAQALHWCDPGGAAGRREARESGSE